MPIDYNQQAQIAYLSWIANEDAAEEREIRTLREYAAGEHPVYLTERQREYLALRAKDANHPFAHNLCQLVIDSVVERLEVTGFARADETVEGEGEDALDLETLAMAWWEANRMDAEQDSLYEEAARDGQSYLIVSWDGPAMRPKWTRNQRYNGEQGVRLYRDPDTGEVVFAAKRWQIYDPFNRDLNGRTRLTLYFPDRVEKYISARGSNRGIAGTIWEPWHDVEGEPWPIAWVDREGQPLGCAVVPFENPSGSEIAALLPLQDMLNKSDLDLIAAADSAGFRILYAKGVPPNINKTTGEETPLKLGPGYALRFSDPNAGLGAIEPADLTQLITTCKFWVEAAAGVTRTPQYLFQSLGGEQPSGESLRNQEIGLINKVTRRQKVFGNAWEDTLYLSARLWNAFATPAVELARLKATWRDPQIAEPTDVVEKRRAEIALLKKQAGVSLPQLQRELGYSDEDIARMATEQQAGDNALGSTLLDNFSRG